MLHAAGEAVRAPEFLIRSQKPFLTAENTSPTEDNVGFSCGSPAPPLSCEYPIVNSAGKKIVAPLKADGSGNVACNDL